MLTPIASALGFKSYDLEVLEPSGGERSKVFHMVHCGAWLLADMRDWEGFPGASKRVSRRGARYVDRNFATEDGAAAAIFLSRAFAAYMEQVMARAGHPDEAEYHRKAAALEEQYLPLADDLLAEIERAKDEFRRLDTKQAPVMPVNGFHMALLDPEHGDPDDPELIEVQLRHANMYFRLEAAKTALRIALTDRQFEKVEEDLLTSMPTGGYEKLTWDLVSLRPWTDTAEKWRVALLL
jgi:hypothetical protein